METSIREALLKIMNGYLDARQAPFKQHPLANYVRGEVISLFESQAMIDPGKYEVSASVGQGNWAHVPWIAVMDRSITTSTQRGYYLVYLFSEDMRTVYLTFAQGVTETPKEEMAQLTKRIQKSIQAHARIKLDGQVYLGTNHRAKQYADSVAAYVRYDYDQMPAEAVLQSDLQEMLLAYENFIQEEQKRWPRDSFPLEEQVVESPYTYELSQQSLVNHIDAYIAGKGFLYSKAEITNLYLSLKTKPFVILSGISGTGKTMIAQWFAQSLGATERNGQLTTIAVRPDWSDGSDLLGYVDIKGDFQTGPFTKVILRALEQPDKPYFVILDEMNLARVEYYFSDILSVMETRSWHDGRIKSSPLLAEQEAGTEVYLPDNLYVIGTVNMDETTHPFSKKVLDRANTIELNHVDLENLSFLGNLEAVEPVMVPQKELATKYLHVKDVYKEHEEVVKKVSHALTEINQSLELMHLHVGYRVRDEISFYLAYNAEADYFTFNEAFDYCVLQKVLPRISGSDSRVDHILRELYQLFTSKAYDDALTDYQHDLATARYPQSARKVLEMLRRLESDGFTSFWVS